MVITLRDHNKAVVHNDPSNAQTDWEKALRAVNLKLNDVPPVFNASCDPPNETEETKGSNAVIFLHATDNRNAWIESFLRGTFLGHLVLMSTQGRAALPTSVCARIHICDYTPMEFKTSQRARLFVDSVNLGTPDWGLLTKLDVSRLHALQIMCESWLMNEGRENVRHRMKIRAGCTEAVEIPVDAPASPSQWFGPFTYNGRAAPEIIADQLGGPNETQKLVTTFFERISRKEICWPESAELVVELCKALKSAAR